VNIINFQTVPKILIHPVYQREAFFAFETFKKEKHVYLCSADFLDSTSQKHHLTFVAGVLREHNKTMKQLINKNIAKHDANYLLSQCNAAT
jgi:hypothetical protein